MASISFKTSRLFEAKCPDFVDEWKERIDDEPFDEPSA
jgi:hypothetical protein